MTPPKFGAAPLSSLLARRHSEDVFIEECKNGPTWSSSYRRLDAWALLKSWSPWRTIGYEIKVARSDFEQDQKWLEYLPVCHQFFFVCPGGLIKGTDLSPGIGLIWASANGQKLFTKIAAEVREPDAKALNQLMSYALMSRSRIVGDMHEANRADEPVKDRLTLYREAIAEAEKYKQLAYFVNTSIRARFDEQGHRLAEMERRCDQADQLAEKLKELGIEWTTDTGVWNVGRQIDRVFGALPPGFTQTVNDARRALDRLDRAIAGLREPVAKDPRGVDDEDR